MGRILAVASNTRREAFRNRAFVVLIILGVVLNATGWALAKLAHSSQHARVMQNFGYFAVSIVAVLAAILMGVILLYKELDKKTIFTLIPKPIHRWQIVVGKFLGLITLLAGLVLFLGAAWYGVMWAFGSLDVAGHSIGPGVARALILIWLESVLITALALLFSSWTRPFLSGVFTFGYFLLGRWIFLLKEHLSASSGVLSEPGPLRHFVKFITYVVPDLQTFNVSRELSLGIEIPNGYVVAAAQYSLSFSVVMLAIGILLFRRRDFV